MDRKTRKAELSIFHELVYKTTEQKSLLVALVCLSVESDLLTQGYEEQRDHGWSLLTKDKSGCVTPWKDCVTRPHGGVQAVELHGEPGNKPTQL